MDANFVERRRVEIFRGLLYVSIALGIAVGIAAFVVASIDRAMERRANVVALRCVGVGAGVLRLAQATQVAVPLATGSFLALLAGKLAEQVTVSVGGLTRAWTWQGLGVSFGVAVAASVIATVSTTFAVSSRIDPSLIRRE